MGFLRCPKSNLCKSVKLQICFGLANKIKLSSDQKSWLFEHILGAFGEINSWLWPPFCRITNPLIHPEQLFVAKESSKSQKKRLKILRCITRQKEVIFFNVNLRLAQPLPQYHTSPENNWPWLRDYFEDYFLLEKGATRKFPMGWFCHGLNNEVTALARLQLPQQLQLQQRTKLRGIDFFISLDFGEASLNRVFLRGRLRWYWSLLAQNQKKKQIPALYISSYFQANKTSFPRGDVEQKGVTDWQETLYIHTCWCHSRS